MKQLDLILMRHAKAEASSASGADHDRPLTPEGVDDAIRMAQVIAPWIPPGTTIIASPFVRTMQTAGAVATRIGSTVIDDVRLGADRPVEDQLDVIRTFMQGPLIVIGHMPTIAEVALRVMGSFDVHLHVRPGTVMGFTWRSPLRMLGTLELYVPPAVVRD